MAQALHTMLAEVISYLGNTGRDLDIKEEVEVEFYIEPYDPDVGIMSEGADIQRVIAYREGKEVDILDDLPLHVKEKLEEQAVRTYQEQGDD